jgi:hypothetical protein
MARLLRLNSGLPARILGAGADGMVVVEVALSDMVQSCELR